MFWGKSKKLAQEKLLTEIEANATLLNKLLVAAENKGYIVKFEPMKNENQAKTPAKSIAKQASKSKQSTKRFFKLNVSKPMLII